MKKSGFIAEVSNGAGVNTCDGRGCAPFAPNLQQHSGHRKSHGAEYETGCAKYHQAADHREKCEHGVELETIADKHGMQKIVDGADDGDAPCSEDQRLAPIALEQEKQRGGAPDHKRAEHRHDSEQGHHDSPQQRRGQSQPPEHQPTEQALDARDGERSIDRGVNRAADAIEQHLHF